MKKILVIGASILQLPAILKAKEMGYCTAVADYNPNAVGVPYADEYYNVSTIDEEGVTKLALKIRPSGIVTIATDMPMRSIAKACSACALPSISYDTAIRSTDKGEMIRAFEAHGVEHPWYHVVCYADELVDVLPTLTYPCVMKPTDNAGSRGVVLCRSVEDVVREYSYSRRESRGGRVIIEEYLRGTEFSVEVMVVGGEPHILQITDKMTTGAPHFVEMGHTQPTSCPVDAEDAIRDLACRAVRAVGINMGPAHVEMILTENGPKMVELGARMGGDCITTHLVPLSTGIDMIRAMIASACGKDPDITAKYERGAAIRYFETPKGKVLSIDGVDEARAVEGVREITFTHGVGETLGDVESSIDRLGFVIADGDTSAQAVAACETAMSKIRVKTGK